MSRIIGTLLFAAATCVATESHAQCQRGDVAVGSRHYDARQLHDQFHNHSYPSKYYYPAAPRYFDPRASRYNDPVYGYPKYYGGFHSSHFDNIGVPPGDIGFRGNGIYWSPW